VVIVVLRMYFTRSYQSGFVLTSGGIAVNQWFSPFLAHDMGHLFKKYPMDHFAMLTPREQLVETLLHIGK